MTHSYLEAAFRHKTMLLGPVLLASTLAVAFAMARPATYVSSASIWADRPITAESTVGTTGGDTPPSSGQQALMSNYLATRSFLLAVADASPIPKIDPAGPAVVVEPALADLAASITTIIPGPNVLAVSVRAQSPEAAVGVTQAVVTEFLERQRSSLRQRAEAQAANARRLLDDRVAQLKDAETRLNAHRVAQLTAPPGQVDGQGVELQGQANRAQAELVASQSAFNDLQAALALSGDKSTLYVIDAPTPAAPLGRARTILFAGIAGLLVGAALGVGGLVLLVSRDTSIRDEADLEKALGVRVTGTVERVDQRAGRVHRTLRHAGETRVGTRTR